MATVKIVKDRLNKRKEAPSVSWKRLLVYGPKGKLALLWLTALGFGTIPLAPGTWGTLAGWVTYTFLPLPTTAALVVGMGATLLTIPASSWASVTAGESDPCWIVADEMWAFYLLLVLLRPQTAAEAVAAFLLFRTLDIVKPFPIRWAERALPLGKGIVVDDLIAAAYSLLFAELIRTYLL